MTGTIVDLATERTQRRMLAERAAEGADAFISGLQMAGRSHADLAWLLTAPVRVRDRELTNGIHQLALQRLGRIIDDAVAEGEWASWSVTKTTGQAKTVAFAAFTDRMLALAAAAAEPKPLSSEPEV